MKAYWYDNVSVSISVASHRIYNTHTIAITPRNPSKPIQEQNDLQNDVHRATSAKTTTPAAPSQNPISNP